MERLQLVFEPFPHEGLVNFISDNVSRFNVAQTGVSDWHPIGYFFKSPRGEYLAGLTGYVWGGWLHVSFLWVGEALRGQGRGSQLLAAAEDFAIERGASGSTLETHSFGALTFYQKRGYAVFGELPDYPPGHAKLFLRKTLTAKMATAHESRPVA